MVVVTAESVQGDRVVAEAREVLQLKGLGEYSDGHAENVEEGCRRQTRTRDKAATRRGSEEQVAHCPRKARRGEREQEGKNGAIAVDHTNNNNRRERK